MKYSCSLEYDRSLSADEQAKRLKDAGFTHCFFTWGFADEGIKKAAAVHKAGLEIETVHASFPGINEIWEAGEAGENRKNYFLDVVRKTAMIGVKTMIQHVSSGPHPPEPNTLGVERFREICAEGERLGVDIAFENLNNITYLHYVMERIDSPVKKYCYDCGHENIHPYKNDGVPEKYGDLLVAVHLHDNMGDWDSHLLPFTGTVDFEKVAARVAKFGRDLPVTLELKADGAPPDYASQAFAAAQKLGKMIEAYGSQSV